MTSSFTLADVGCFRVDGVWWALAWWAWLPEMKRGALAEPDGRGLMFLLLGSLVCFLSLK